jgi:predicted Fe-Mo cluster-binding NifX family protein
MKIAVTYENGEIFQHFGHSEQFKIYEVEDGEIISSEVVSTMGNEHGALVEILQDQNIDTLICGGIGGGAKNALEEAGIKLYGGVVGSVDTAVKNLLDNNLDYNSEIECDHHHNEEHNCGEHSCSDH